LGEDINENKTKYMVAGHHRVPALQKISTQEYTCKRVDQFLYLASVLINDNDISAGTRTRPLADSKCYFSLGMS
jgi:uncharacterized protein (DUF1015 family)